MNKAGKLPDVKIDPTIGLLDLVGFSVPMRYDYESETIFITREASSYTVEEIAEFLAHEFLHHILAEKNLELAEKLDNLDRRGLLRRGSDFGRKSKEVKLRGIKRKIANLKYEKQIRGINMKDKILIEFDSEDMDLIFEAEDKLLSLLKSLDESANPFALDQLLLFIDFWPLSHAIIFPSQSHPRTIRKGWRILTS